jgi:hypothetical protein
MVADATTVACQRSDSGTGHRVACAILRRAPTRPSEIGVILMHLNHRVRRRVLHASVLLAAAAGVLAAVPQAANASLPPPSGTLVFHVCRVMGHDQDGNSAVHCADLYSVPDSEPPQPGTEWVAENEVFCEHGSTVEQCAGIHETAYEAEAEQNLPVGPEGICGVRFGHDACQAIRVTNTAKVNVLESGGSLTCHIWAVSMNDSVVLPVSGLTVTDPLGNVGTPHQAITCAI